MEKKMVRSILNSRNDRMKKLLFLSIFIISFGNAQNHRFSYIYQFVPDSTNQSDIRSEMMILDVLPKFSKFYSEVVFKSDSTMLATLEKEVAATGSMNVRTDMQKGFVRTTVIKESPDFKTFLVTRIGQIKFKVEDDRKIVWKILPEKQKIGEFQTQKAETEMYGRKWTAWFTPEIPIQEGPYKFQGLPGLILKISDETKSHSYILNGIKNLKPAEIAQIDPNNNFVFDYGNAVKISQIEYKKQFLESRNDPNKSIRQNFANSDMAQINIDGKMTNVSEYLRDREKQQKAKIAKDNNIIELDLLK